MDFLLNKNKDFCEEIFKKVCPNGAVGCCDHYRKKQNDYRIFQNLYGVDELFSDEDGELWARIGYDTYLVKKLSEFGKLLYDRAGYYAKDIYEDSHKGVSFSVGEKFENLFQNKNL